MLDKYVSILRKVLQDILRCSFVVEQMCIWHKNCKILRFVDRASRFNRVKKNQLESQHILSISRQPLHAPGVSRPIIRSYNRMYATIGTYYSS